MGLTELDKLKKKYKKCRTKLKKCRKRLKSSSPKPHRTPKRPLVLH